MFKILVKVAIILLVGTAAATGWQSSWNPFQNINSPESKLSALRREFVANKAKAEEFSNIAKAAHQHAIRWEQEMIADEQFIKVTTNDELFGEELLTRREADLEYRRSQHARAAANVAQKAKEDQAKQIKQRALKIRKEMRDQEAEKTAYRYAESGY